MYRGTTPTISFTLPFLTETLSSAYITFTQNGVSIIEKNLGDCTIGDCSLTVALTQAETLSLAADSSAEVQIRLKTTEGNALASNIISVPVNRILKEGEI